MWTDAIPNLLIGLREGLEAGLVVSILLAAVRKTEPAAGAGSRRVSSAPVWLGVLGAVMLAGSFAAVLTYSTNVLSSEAQEAVGGLLERARGGPGHRDGVLDAPHRRRAGSAPARRGAARGRDRAGVLTITAFLAVGREGLETTLFLWAAVRASGSTLAPLAGAGLGLAAAVVLCWLLYRRTVRLDVGAFFNRTAIALIVIAAGVLSYGLGDLQDAGLLPGRHWVAFDLTVHVDPGSWWVSIVTGVTELAPKMTVLQVVTWVAYLAVVIPVLIRAGRLAPVSPSASSPAAGPASWERLAAQRTWTIAGVLVAVSAVAAGVVVAALPAAGTTATTAVTVTRDGCARDWTSAQAGTQTFTVSNQSSKAGEINLDDAAGGVVAEIETLGPATTADMTATLGSGTYTISCILSGQPVTSSAPVQVTAQRSQAVSVAVKPVTVQELTGPNQAYQAYAADQLAALADAVTTIGADLGRGNLTAARKDWLAAQLDWERVGASYDSSGADGIAVDGLPDGLPDGVNDQAFTGLHRLEYGLWHNQSAASLEPVAAVLARDVATVRKNLTSDDLAGDPTNLPIRAHEILEDALRDHLSGIDDQGSGSAYPQTNADLQVTRVVLDELSTLISARAPKLLPAAQTQVDALEQALLATAGGQWRAPGSVRLLARQQVDAAAGALLETLSQVPDLLEVPPTP